MAKEIIFSEEARSKIKAGIDKVAKAVKTTVGPRGRNVILEKSYGSPTITNDGVSIAKEIELEDRFENLGASIVKEVASKTNDLVGDGTTTAVILTQAIIGEGMKNIVMGASPMAIKSGIEKASEIVREILKKKAKAVRGQKEIASIAAVSSESKEIGGIIAKTIEKVGQDGVVTVEESQTLGIDSEVVEGLELSQGYLSPYMISDPERMESELKEASVLITDKKISNIKELLPLLEAFANSGKKNLLIIAENIEGEALATLILNKLRGSLNVLAVKAPGFGDDKKAILEDIAITTGGQVVSEEVSMKLENVGLEVLGSADRVVSDKDKTIIVGGKGKKSEIEKRISLLRSQSEKQDSAFSKEKLQKRAGKLSGGVAVIKVGAATESEMKYLKLKIEDAVNATKAAIEEGIVAGGGSVLVKTAIEAKEKMPKMNREEEVGYKIVLKALEAPARQIASNAGRDDGVILQKIIDGGELAGYDAKEDKMLEDMIVSGIIDPVKVTRSGVLNACSASAVLLTTEVAITEKAGEEKADSPPMMPGGGMGGMM